jgi:hypothetical protein
VILTEIDPDLGKEAAMAQRRGTRVDGGAFDVYCCPHSAEFHGVLHSKHKIDVDIRRA